MKKILCCIPTIGNIRIELARQLCQWKARYGNFFDVYSSPTRPLYEARNECVRTFLSSNASYLFFVDSDAVPASDAIERLLSHGFNRKIVGGLCSEIKVDTDGLRKVVPLVLRKVRKGYKLMDVPLKGLVEVDATGTICVMIHRSVFSEVTEPYFYDRAEDFYFYEKAKEAGLSVFVDCDCKVTHWTSIGI